MKYIYQNDNWPNFSWDSASFQSLLGEVRNKQGKISAKMEALGFELQEQTLLNTLTLDIIKSSEIEGEILSTDMVRSSVARKLGMDIAGLIPSDRNIDGVVEMLLDATQKYNSPLNEKRLFGWHKSLFPLGSNSYYKISIGKWRTDEKGPMQVVSGGIGSEKIHFQAPEANQINSEIKTFFKWFNLENGIDPVLKAAVAHLWFITIHPFDDGNGRIARAITDLQLCKAEGSSKRFYSMSAQIRLKRKQYYTVLEQVQKGNLDITDWLKWFFETLLTSLNTTETSLESVLMKARFWDMYSKITFNERQKIMLNKILDGFEGNLTSSKWAKIAKCSPDSALRDIQDLISKNILEKNNAGGRSTSYILIFA
ncbi:MAG: Fic family protein [Bacteroidota bacterium]